MNVSFVAVYTGQQAPHGYGLVMNPAKQHRKLKKLQLKAQDCLSREEAQRIIKKAEKAHRKLAEGDNS